VPDRRARPTPSSAHRISGAFDEPAVSVYGDRFAAIADRNFADGTRWRASWNRPASRALVGGRGPNTYSAVTHGDGIVPRNAADGILMSGRGNPE
jgi:hypothetical protein